MASQHRWWHRWKYRFALIGSTTLPPGRQGHTSSSWTPAIDNRKNEVIKIKFSTRDCGICPRLTSCTSSQSPTPRRLITVRPNAQHEALQAARRREQTPAFARQYAQREGIEATISQGVRAFDMRRSRYVGENKPIPTEYPARINSTPHRHS